ncbi:MAG: RNA polymerase sigma factor SigZ [Planctomycetota bacterium]
MTDQAIKTEDVWELLSDRLRNFFLSRVSDPQVADDLLQETFLRIHTGLSEIRDEERLTSWGFQVGRNLVIDHYRSKDKAAGPISDDFALGEDLERGNLNGVVADWLPELIAKLPESYREAVKLYEIEGLPQQEIAERLNLSLSGAKSRVQRGREKLKSLLFDCCAFEKDRRGNVIDCSENSPSDGRCGDGCC